MISDDVEQVTTFLEYCSICRGVYSAIDYHTSCLGHSRTSGSILFHFCHTTTPPTASNRVNTFSRSH